MNPKKQNFDGINKPAGRIVGAITKRQTRPISRIKSARHRLTVPMDGIARQKKRLIAPHAAVSIPTAFTVPYRPRKAFKFRNKLSGIYRRAPQFVPLVLSLCLAFGGGMWYALRTPEISAQTEQVAPQVESAQISAPIVIGSMPAAKSDPAISNDLLFNTPIEMLKDYLASSAAQDRLDVRKAKLHEFLKSRNSPLEPQADLIAEQDHWKLILAISFAESTLGQHCEWSNCSGIGGSELRKYKSFDNWILDFNRLLEDRYKDKTLEQMCGVYVQPCTTNWLMATKQILTSLDQENIN